MIFGFNTDIRHEETVYHVQSEAREAEQLLQTQVFVRGRCIGKRAFSYASGIEQLESGDQSFLPAEVNEGTNIDGINKDQYKEKLLRDQHRQVLDAIREGRLDSVLDKRDTAEALASVRELDVQWTNAESVHAQGSLLMNFKVTEGGMPVTGARLTFRFARPAAGPYYAQVLTDGQGMAEMSLQVDEQSLPDSSVLVQATFGGRTATRKFRLRSNN